MVASLADRRYVAKVRQRPAYDADGNCTGVQHGYDRFDGSFVRCSSWQHALAACWQANQEAA